MTLKEKRQQESDLLKNARIVRILEASKKLFSEKGIEAVTMIDIADTAEIGVASLYRYFKTKEELAVQCVSYEWETRERYFETKFNSDVYRNKTGVSQLETLLDVFCLQFQQDDSFYRLIYNFDSFIQRRGIKGTPLTGYEAQILVTKRIVTDALRKGFRDGSIKTGCTEDVLYYTLMHSMFALAQKLSLSGDMLESDRVVPAVCQLRLLSQLLIASLRG